MENALIIGSSGGIGAAVGAELAARGYSVTGLSRAGDGLDIRSPEVVDTLMGRLDGPFARIFVATGILAPEGAAPEKSLAAIDADVMAQVLWANTIGPALILRHAARLLPKDAPSVCAVLTARVGSIGDNKMGGWHSYRASKAAANQIVHGAGVELARSHKQSCVVALHPGTVATEFTAGYPAHKKVDAGQAAANLCDVMDGLTPAQTGGFFDYSGAEVPW